MVLGWKTKPRKYWQAAKDGMKCSRCFSSLIKQANMRLSEALGMRRKKATDGEENESARASCGAQETLLTKKENGCQG